LLILKNNKMKISSSRILLIVISLLLIIIPFFWLKPGEMDLGGDGGRLYFYDPINQFYNLAFYYVSPFNVGAVNANFAYIPFISILIIVKQVINSPYMLISINNAVKLMFGFISVYLIVKELAGKINENNRLFVKLASILAGLFYLSSPAMISNYVTALLTNNQIFLNPLMFYLFLKFSLTGNMRYMWIALATSLVFANNFSYQSAPSFFAFYPLAFLFIFVYSIVIRHIRFPWEKLLIVLLLFFGLHVFHIVPEFLTLLTAGSDINTRVFDASDIKEQIGYFYGVLQIPKLSFYLLSYSSTKYLINIAIIIPLILALGLLFNARKNKTLSLVALFFLLTFFFVTGKVTNVGIKFYELLFYIPGFTMFRNFYGQWQFTFYFFYSLLFGLSLFSFLHKLGFKFFYKIIFLIIVLYFTISSWRFISGELVNPIHEETENVRIGTIMDPKYENTLAFIRSFPDDAKILVLPFTDSYMQVIYGLNNGAYVGHSTIGQLTGKKDFAGYVEMAPYSDLFWKLSKEKNYEDIKSLLGILNIHYIFYNSDERIYDTVFLGRPYSPDYVRKYMPASQAEYKEYVRNITSEKIYESSFYNIYKLANKFLIPHFYIPDKILIYKDDSSFDAYSKATAFFRGSIAKAPIYIEEKNCKNLFSEKQCINDTILMNENSSKIQFEKINPTKYKVRVFNAKDSYVLSFLEAFNKGWKVYIPGGRQKGNFVNNFYGKIFETIGMKSLSENAHFTANGYSNAWYISPKDINNKSDYELIVEMTGQRIFYISLVISIVILIGFLLWGIKLFQIIKKISMVFGKIKSRL